MNVSIRTSLELVPVAAALAFLPAASLARAKTAKPPKAPKSAATDTLEVESLTTGGVCGPTFVCAHEPGAKADDIRAVDFAFASDALAMDLADFFQARLDELRKNEPNVTFAYKLYGHSTHESFKADRIELENKGKAAPAAKQPQKTSP